MIEIIRPGLLATVQDLGRPGFAHLGVPHSGAADPVSLRLANRLLGNPEGAAALELTFGGAVLRFHSAAWIAVTGAPLPLSVAAQTARPLHCGVNAPCRVPAGAVVELGIPARGLRSYVAVRGGVEAEQVLGSRSTDLLSGLGPAVLKAGDRLPVGPPPDTEIIVDVAAIAEPATDPVLHIIPGPRADWFADHALDRLLYNTYEVTSRSNRIGVRLDGPPLPRAREGELASEGMVTGAIQVPPEGRPIVFLADHPTTGGYPVIAVVALRDIGTAGQLRPGQKVRFALSTRR